MFNESLQPYKDDPGSFGLQLTDMDVLCNATLESDKLGLQVRMFYLYAYAQILFTISESNNVSFQVAIHAIGDKANGMLLDMFDKVANLNGAKDRRFRVRFMIAYGRSTLPSCHFCSS